MLLHRSSNLIENNKCKTIRIYHSNLNCSNLPLLLLGVQMSSTAQDLNFLLDKIIKKFLLRQIISFERSLFRTVFDLKEFRAFLFRAIVADIEHIFIHSIKTKRNIQAASKTNFELKRGNFCSAFIQA